MREKMLRVLRENTGSDGILTVKYEQLVELLEEVVRNEDSGLRATVEKIAGLDLFTYGEPVNLARAVLEVGKWRDLSLFLTPEQVTAACRNIGYDLTCATCAEIFYTGVSVHLHDADCMSSGVILDVVSVAREIEDTCGRDTAAAKRIVDMSRKGSTKCPGS